MQFSPPNDDASSPFLNTSYFDRQLIFSINMDSHDPNLRELLSKGIGRYEPVKGRAFFFVQKRDQNYPEMKIKINRMGYKVRELEDILWFRVGIPSFTNEAVVKELEGKPFAKMDGVTIYPFTVYSGGRLYYAVQYRNDAEVEVSERVLSSISAYEKVFGHDSFRVESISRPQEIREILARLGIDSPLTEITLSVERRSSPPSPYLREHSGSKTFKWPFRNNGVISLETFEEILDYAEIPESALIEFYESFIKRFVASLYFDGTATRDRVVFKVIVEASLSANAFSLLSISVRNSGKVILERVRRL
ncbi:MAG: hypothetical protein M0Z77_05505 [Thermoplasmatales archaeon]|nr:hypothetical protein [Candidatus Thermoplasmatota archaeon]MDA8055093.1 hypothetical protein [Thermoplasmatales archaeon]